MDLAEARLIVEELKKNWEKLQAEPGFVEEYRNEVTAYLESRAEKPSASSEDMSLWSAADLEHVKVESKRLLYNYAPNLYEQLPSSDKSVLQRPTPSRPEREQEEITIVANEYIKLGTSPNQPNKS